MSSANTSPAAPVSALRGPSGGDRVLAALQSVGRSLMLPIAVLPAAALLLRFGQSDLFDLPFFAGNRFFPILTALSALILGAIFGLIWPPIQIGINALGLGIVALGPIGTGIYGFLNRLLIPVGLHHVLNSYVWFQLGTYHGPQGVVNGDLTRY